MLNTDLQPIAENVCPAFSYNYITKGFVFSDLVRSATAITAELLIT